MKRASVASSSLRSLGYDPEQQMLEVEFSGGAVYRYEQVPPEAVQALLEADSLGRHFNQVFKPQHYAYRRVQ
ncbi:KTSC domain-containing protein [Stutzerimonas nitrititolerans]|uniref:KTSC domain-containing protein n=1 Tax=Stutzerimonas nitrititolerans TaxID=2482751 RepID=A0AA42BDZ6_9GAMM|nr:KTSC domain-containing protein [Stutzerimonas nitrititolerans]RRV24168.1 KTSC domain-containing protein [Pseudomonas sp. s199]HAQ73891.1 KTSC domain-containing protein [Pseudomonas sp.]MBT1120228.1 KTSC domain-containing protein [Stutzerimonas nitrititolerans]MCO7545110.1 KTSC domain-containing protein [Stutzerimonas nitrititolerans]HJE27917.1 KTSC domain-containing protein [Stutzerimonas nitrititolerans]